MKVSQEVILNFLKGSAKKDWNIRIPPGREIIKGMFPMRNRILAGISMGTLVVESGIKGGSRITASLALEYGRDVFSVPGNIFLESSEGCNLLISQGANLVSSKEEFNTLLEDCIHRGS